MITAYDYCFWRVARAEVFLPLRVELKIRAVVVEQRLLCLRSALAALHRAYTSPARWGIGVPRAHRSLLPLCQLELLEREERQSLGSRR